jgi:rhodanese-related sulfurtransferase
VVTQTETVPLQLPDSMKVQLGFFGKSLGAPMVDLQDRADTLIEGLCKGQLLCKTIGQRTFNNYLSANHNKAMAIGWGKTGYGVRWGVDDPGQAILRALYNCNHAKNNPKLCRLVSVNEHEVLPLYDEASTQAAAFLGQLQTPSPERIEAEREEPGARTPSKLRWGQALTGMTPKALEGIQRWDTGTLAQALRQTDRPVVIDAARLGPVIPGSLSFINSGLAFEDDKLEQPYAERFGQMLRAAAPDLNQPVVFYCSNSESWLSVNAAMRARQMGYTQVIWYRGGFAAWTQAGLPTVGRVPVAVLY